MNEIIRVLRASGYECVYSATNDDYSIYDNDVLGAYIGRLFVNAHHAVFAPNHDNCSMPSYGRIVAIIANNG